MAGFVCLSKNDDRDVGLHFTQQTFSYWRYVGARPYAGFQRISEFQSNASSNYNGLSLELKRRFASNFQGTIAWTWSHVTRRLT